MGVAYTYRPKLLVEVEIAAARLAFLAADEAEDYTAADAHYERMNDLLEEYGHIPHPRPAS